MSVDNYIILKRNRSIWTHSLRQERRKSQWYGGTISNSVTVMCQVACQISLPLSLPHKRANPVYHIRQEPALSTRKQEWRADIHFICWFKIVPRTVIPYVSEVHTAFGCLPFSWVFLFFPCLSSALVSLFFSQWQICDLNCSRQQRFILLHNFISKANCSVCLVFVFVFSFLEGRKSCYLLRKICHENLLMVWQ